MFEGQSAQSLGKVFGHKRGQVTGRWKKLRTKRLLVDIYHIGKGKSNQGKRNWQMTLSRLGEKSDAYNI
jgi:hypothetical protein